MKEKIYITPEQARKWVVPADSGDYTYIAGHLNVKLEKDDSIVLDAKIKELSERVARIEAWQNSMMEFIKQAFNIAE